MLTAIVFLRRGAARNLVLKELRRLRVRVQEPPDPDQEIFKNRNSAVDFIVVGSDAAQGTFVRQFLGRKRSRGPVIMVQTSNAPHASSAYDESMWCIHQPVKSCLIRAYVQSIMDQKKLSNQLTRSSLILKELEKHSVDDLWLAIFERLKQNRRG